MTPEERRKDRFDRFCIVFGMANDIDPNIIKNYAHRLQHSRNRAYAMMTNGGWSNPSGFRMAVEDSAFDETPEQVHAKLVSQMREKLFLR